jgi:hypothetical protein
MAAQLAVWASYQAVLRESDAARRARLIETYERDQAELIRRDEALAAEIRRTRG